MNDTISSDYLSSLLALADEVGLEAVGVASAEPFDEAREELEARRSRGLASSMQFTYRNPARSCDPSVALTGSKVADSGCAEIRGWRGNRQRREDWQGSRERSCERN